MIMAAILFDTANKILKDSGINHRFWDIICAPNQKLSPHRRAFVFSAVYFLIYCCRNWYLKIFLSRIIIALSWEIRTLPDGSDTSWSGPVPFKSIPFLTTLIGRFSVQNKPFQLYINPFSATMFIDVSNEDIVKRGTCYGKFFFIDFILHKCRLPQSVSLPGCAFVFSWYFHIFTSISLYFLCRRCFYWTRPEVS